MGQIKLPRLRYRKGAKLTKNPYKIKVIPLPDESKRPKRILDGYAIIEEAKCEFPNDVIKIKLSSTVYFRFCFHSRRLISSLCSNLEKNMVQTKVEDLGWFIYLVEIDVSENELALEDFIFLSGLQTLNISANKIETVRLSQSHTFKLLETLDISFNRLTVSSIESLASISLLQYILIILSF